MNVAEYLARTELSLDKKAIDHASRSLDEVLSEMRRASVPATPHALDRLYLYRVPRLSPEGTCSLAGDLDETPYDLVKPLGGRTAHSTMSLMVLNALLDRVRDATQLDWLGIYQARTLSSGRALVKLAARGAPSRAEFPLTSAWASMSNNVAVGLTGVARRINNIEEHVRSGGAYYECTATVRSELCVPLFDTSGSVGGVLDAEHSTIDAFSDEAAGWVVACALVAAGHLPEAS